MYATNFTTNYAIMLPNVFTSFASILQLSIQSLFLWLGYLIHFMQLVSFYSPWKHQKTRGFLMFSEGIERDLWHEMGLSEHFSGPILFTFERFQWDSVLIFFRFFKYFVSKDLRAAIRWCSWKLISESSQKNVRYRFKFR